MKIYYYIKMYFWALKTSYSYMEGLRDVQFWLVLPFKAHQIAYATVYPHEELGSEFTTYTGEL